MQPNLSFISVALFTAVLTHPAQAEDFYVEGFVGALFSEETDDFTATDRIWSSTLGARAGYDWTENFSLEAELQTSLNEEKLYIGTDGNHVSMRSNAAIFGRFALPLNERLSLHARIGFASTEFETSIGPYEYINKYDGGAYGLGGAFDITDKVYIRGDLTRYDTGAVESDSVTLGAGFRF